MKKSIRNNLLSVIIPAYNEESYIERCISSVRNQTYTDLEIIVVDDGLTDGTGHIINEVSNQDSRIKAIHKKNEERITARKDGIKEASCRYITFVDSDDWIKTDMYSSMMLH